MAFDVSSLTTSAARSFVSSSAPSSVNQSTTSRLAVRSVARSPSYSRCNTAPGSRGASFMAEGFSSPAGG